MICVIGIDPEARGSCATLDERAALALADEQERAEATADELLRLAVYGIPAPKGSLRYRGRTASGRPYLANDCVRTEDWQAAIQIAVHDAARGMRPVEGPVDVETIFTVPKPRSAPKRARTYPTKKPDADKLKRAVFDALTDAGVWLDDAQVVDDRGGKRYPGEGPDALDRPGVLIVVRRPAW